MKRLALATFVLAQAPVLTAAAFTNLNFEAANFPYIPPGEFEDYESPFPCAIPVVMDSRTKPATT